MLRSILVALTESIGIMVCLAGLWILLKDYRKYQQDRARLKIKVDFVADAATQYLTIHSLGAKPVAIAAVRYFLMPHNWWEKPIKGLQHSIGRWLYKQEFTPAIELFTGENPPIAIELPHRLKIYTIYKAEVIELSGKRWSVEWSNKALAKLGKATRHKITAASIQSPKKTHPYREPPRMRPRFRRRYSSIRRDPYSVSAILEQIRKDIHLVGSFFANYPQRQRDKTRLRSVAHFDFKTANLQGNTITIQLRGKQPVVLTGIRYFIMPQSFWKKLFRAYQHRKGRWLYDQDFPEKIHLSRGESATVTIDLPAKVKLHRIYRAQIIVQSQQHYCDVQWPSLRKLAVFAPIKFKFIELLLHKPRSRTVPPKKDEPVRLATRLNRRYLALKNWQSSQQQRREEVENRSHLIVSANFDFDTLNAANNTITVQSLGKKAVTISRVRYFITPSGLWGKLFRNDQHRKGRWFWDQALVDKINLNEGEQTTIKIDLPYRLKLSRIYKAEVIEQTRQRWQVRYWPSASKLAEFVADEPAVAELKLNKTPHRQYYYRERKRTSYTENDSTLYGEADFAFMSPTEPQYSISLYATGKNPLIIEIIRYYILPRSRWKRWSKNWQHRKGLWLFDQALIPNLKIMEGKIATVSIKLPRKIKTYKIYKVEAIDHLGRHWAIEWPTRSELKILTSIEQLNFFERKNDQRLCRARGFRLGHHFYLASQFGTLANATEQLSQRNFWLSDLQSYQDKYQELNDYQCKQFLNAEINEFT